MKHTIHVSADHAEFFATIPEATPSAKVNRALELVECMVNRVAIDLRVTFTIEEWTFLKSTGTNAHSEKWKSLSKDGNYDEKSLWIELLKLDRSHVKVLDWMLDMWEMQGVGPWE